MINKEQKENNDINEDIKIYLKENENINNDNNLKEDNKRASKAKKHWNYKETRSQRWW